ncbi:MAG: HAMP domain-containing sensor histidine kinase [Bryobacteraceae bacterium]|jgi:two-component system NtrC family sensor kinase
MRSLSAKLIAGLAVSLAAVLLWLGAANLRVLRENLETTAVVTEQRMAGVIFQSTRTSMLKNDREQLLEIIRSIGAQPGVKKIRVFSKTGTVQISTVPGEAGTMVDKRAEACYGCHASERPLEKPHTRDTFRIYRVGNERVIGLVRPIENEPACSNAACHAHPPSQRILGVLDVVLSLEPVDRALAEHERRMQAQVVASAALMLGITALLVFLLIRRPIERLTAGVKALAAGNLSYRFRSRRRDEIGELATAFDSMAGELEDVNRTLEDRIQRKTGELEAAQEKLIHSEKLASLGELAAAVAHEINNPLAGILTYAKLIEKKLAPARPVLDWVQTIQHESRRCGEIVSNLLVFARKHPTEMAPAHVKTIVERTVAVVRHKLEMQGIALDCEVPELPEVHCDASQIQQVLVAIIMNAVDAISSPGGAGGSISIRASAAGDWLDLSVTNDGPPIAKDVLPHLFEPFFSTKQATSGVGLGLAVAYGIVKRHGGDIQVETGPQTTFHVVLPLGEPAAAHQETEKRDVGTEVVDTHRG